MQAFAHGVCFSVEKKNLYPYDDRVKICDPHASVALGFIIRVMENYLKSRIQESRRVSIN